MRELMNKNLKLFSMEIGGWKEMEKGSRNISLTEQPKKTNSVEREYFFFFYYIIRN